jgi:hypothetical protein
MMITKEIIDNFYNSLPAYGVDRLIVKIDENNITVLEENTFTAKDKYGKSHWYCYDELMQNYSEAVKLHKKKQKKRILTDIKYCESDIKCYTKKIERLQKSLSKL